MTAGVTTQKYGRPHQSKTPKPTLIKKEKRYSSFAFIGMINNPSSNAYEKTTYSNPNTTPKPHQWIGKRQDEKIFVSCQDAIPTTRNTVKNKKFCQLRFFDITSALYSQDPYAWSATTAHLQLIPQSRMLSSQ